ncbi:MAG: ATP-grasp domain-containing protein [Planctomycetota bacterium]
MQPQPRTISRVLVQKKDREFVSPNSFAAWRGLTERGFTSQFFEWPELRDGQIAVEPETLVVGGSGVVRHALGRLGVKTPAIDDLPEPLAEFCGRQVWHSTWGSICARYDEPNLALFVKPLDDPKAFPARVIASFRDLIPLSHLPANKPVLVSETVEFVSEWRFFVLNKRIVGSGWYAGDPLTFPDPDVVSDAVQAWGAEAPAGYGIDFGVVAPGKTLLVEVNDGFSLGCLGLRPQLYSQILEARWLELLSKRSPAP